MKNAILFDLGNTLVRYYEREEFPAILRQSITEVRDHLPQEGLLTVPAQAMWQRVKEEDHVAADHRVRPLEERLARIFDLPAPTARAHPGCHPGPSAGARDFGETQDTLCRCFMKPIFARAQVYEDALPTLRRLRSKGFKTAVVSNTPWGSPAHLWRQELQRLGLSEHLDAAVFCRDVGWRKPAREIFEFALQTLQAGPQECIFVGDDPRWDIVGPAGVGMDAILLDRSGAPHEDCRDIINALGELSGWLKS
ncbi:MAG: HAD family hydrolase [Candidatus Brocadiae bacterium]|nr:HAD family hydrolase [Candidatus Brocadiia bacterium]